jgi:hypothetical protein
VRFIDRSDVGGFTTTGDPKNPCLSDLLTCVNLNEGNADARRAAIIDIRQSKVDRWHRSAGN